MKKTASKLIVLSIAALLVLSVCAFVACNVNQPKLEVTVASNADVKAGDSLDTVKQYLIVKYTAANNKTATVTDYELHGVLTEGQTTLTVSCLGLTTTCAITVKSNSQSSDNKLIKPEVLVNANGGTVNGEFTVNDDGSLTPPAAPTRDGYKFAGWFKNIACTNEWNFETDRITIGYFESDAVGVYVKWIRICNVTFNTNGGSAIDAIEVDENTAIVQPADPTKEGYKFVGWFADEECTTAWNFALNVVTTDTTLYADWEEVVVVIQELDYTLNDDGETYSVSGIGTVTDTDIVIPSTYNNKPVTAIGFASLSNLKLTSVTIPYGVTKIDGWAFAGCKWLESITIPHSVTEIGEFAFIFCESLTSVEIPDSVRTIGGNAFFCCHELTSIKLSNNLTELSGSLLRDCHSLTSVTVPVGVTKIGNWAFGECSSLTNVDLPNTVTEIEQSAFEGCHSLVDITIPSSVTAIGSWVFDYCESLTSVYFDGNVADWCNIYFNGLSANPLYYIQDLYINGELVTELVIPDTVTEINLVAFYNCTNLTKLVISPNLTAFDWDSFRNCTNLAEIEFDGTVEQWNELKKWGNLTKTNIPATKVTCTDGEVAL